MNNNPEINEIITYYESVTGKKYQNLEKLVSSFSNDEYYDFKYYLLNTFYWSKNSNEIIWEIFQDFVDKPVASILDFGCGSGLYAKRLKKYCVTYTGTDISKSGIQIAKEINKDISNVHFVDLVDFYSSNTKFDLIFCSETLDHIDNPKKTLRYLKSRLSDGGRLILTTTTIYHYIFRILFQHIPNDLVNLNFKNVIYRPLLYFQALFSFSKRSKLMKVGLGRDDHKNAFTLREHFYLAKKVGLCIEQFEYFTCKDIFPGKLFKGINLILKKYLRRSKVYGSNIVICLKNC